MMMMAKTVSVLRANSVLKKSNSVLVKISSNITCEYKMEVHNAPIFQSKELLPSDLILKPTERLNQILCD